ncbi:MAG: hypothetical protein NG747_07460 [Candidatus Brocadia sp.]|nr:hypothetical protein [Candidatus Brocadia sp.]
MAEPKRQVLPVGQRNTCKGDTNMQRHLIAALMDGKRLDILLNLNFTIRREDYGKQNYLGIADGQGTVKITN